MSGARKRFVRARRADEKAVRRDAILGAAARLMDQMPIGDVSLNGIAESAGISKPNVYRYFQSREEILLRLFIADLEEFAAQVEEQLSRDAHRRSPQNPPALIARAYEARPRLCRFLGVLSTVLEQNVDSTVALELKRASLAAASRAARALHAAYPHLTVEQCLWLNNMVALLVAGLWPPSHPPEAVQAVLRQREFSALRPVFRRDLERAITVLVAGLGAD